MELGGKSPMVVFEDAKLDDAVSAAMVANFYTQEVKCALVEPEFMCMSLCMRLLSQLKQRTEKLIVGDPMDMDTQIGSSNFASAS